MLLVKARRVVPKQLLLRRRLEALPGEDVVHRLGELTLRMRVVRGVHQDIVAEKSGDGGEHVLALLMLDAAEEAAARQVFARLPSELGGRADIGVLLVHAPS